jgi:hypothetical protein
MIPRILHRRRRCRFRADQGANPSTICIRCISNFLANGKDLVLAQRQARHAEISTTARYDLLLLLFLSDLQAAYPSPGDERKVSNPLNTLRKAMLSQGGEWSAS